MEYIDCNVYHHSFVGKDPHHWHGILSMFHVRKLKKRNACEYWNIVNVGILDYCEYWNMLREENLDNAQ